MLSFILENLATIIVGAVVLAMVTAATIKTVRDKKKSSCSLGCSGCPSAGKCGHNQ